MGVNTAPRNVCGRCTIPKTVPRLDAMQLGPDESALVRRLRPLLRGGVLSERDRVTEVRITFIIPFAAPTGGIRVVATYARHLCDLGHEVTVISQPTPDRRRGLRAGLLRRLGLLRSLPPMPANPLLEYPGVDHRVLSMQGPPTPADVPDADVIVATWWETAEWVAALPSSKGRKFYLLQGYEVFPSQPKDRVIATYGLDLRKIAVSGYVRDAVLAHVPDADIQIVHNAVDMTQFDASPRGRNGDLRVGFLYKSAPLKNATLAVEAIGLAREKLVELKVLAFGTEHPRDDPPLPEGTDYHLLPPQDAIPGLYAACDLWLFTSRPEGFGLPILEAMACRTPVLATRSGAAPDLIDGQNGTLLPSDAAAFAAEIVRIASLPAERWRDMSDAAAATARANDWQRATERLLACFEDRES